MLRPEDCLLFHRLLSQQRVSEGVLLECLRELAVGTDPEATLASLLQSRGHADLLQGAASSPTVLGATLALDAPSSAVARPTTTVRKTEVTLPAGATARPGPEPGRLVGRYEVLGELGRGGMGSVYRCRDTVLHRTVALKLLTGALSEESLARFSREVRTAARLRHPGIVAIHEVGEHEGAPFFTMDCIEGRTLEAVNADDRVTLRDRLELVRRVAEALQFAHEAGVIHRDIKPSNILVDATGHPFLTDFGLAKEVSSTTRITLSGAVMGTPAYMSPEQAMGEGAGPDARSDVYSLGVVLYELLTRGPMFEGPDPMVILYKVMAVDPRPVRQVNRRVHPDVETICMKAIQKEPPLRYAGAREFAADLQRFLDGEPIEARPIGRMRRAWRRVKRHRAAAVACAAGVLAVGVLLAAHEARAREYEEQLRAERLREERHRQAQELIVEADKAAPAAALVLLEKARELEPASAEVHAHRARLLLAGGSLFEGLNAVEAALRAAPGSSRALLLRARALGCPAIATVQARKDLTAAAAAKDVDGRTAAALARLRGIPGTAETDTRSLVADHPENAILRHGMGLAAEAEGSAEEAVRRLAKAGELFPADPLPWIDAARVSNGICEYERALEFARRALGACGSHPAARFQEATALLWLGNPREAAAGFEKALQERAAWAKELERFGPAEDSEVEEWRYALGRARQAAGDGQGAAAAFDAIRADSPWAAWGRLQLAFAQENAGALPPLLAALESAGDPARAPFVAAVQARTKREPAALERVRALTRTPRTPAAGFHLLGDEQSHKVAQRRGAIAEEDGDYRLAKRAYERALDLNPLDAVAWLGLARLRRQRMQITDAITLAEKAIGIDPGLAEAHLHLARLRIDYPLTRDVERAEREFDEAMRLAPEDPVPAMERGILELGRREPEAALGFFAEARKRRADFGPVRLFEARAYESLGRAEDRWKALQAWGTGSRDHPVSRGYRMLASRFGNDRFKLGMQFALRAMAYDCADADAMEDYAECLLRQQRFGEAMYLHVLGVRFNPDHTARFLASFQDYFRQAVALLPIVWNQIRQVEQTREKDPVVQAMKGVVHFHTGRFDAAREAFEAGLAVDPDFFTVRTLLGAADLRLEKLDEARTNLERSRAALPDEPLTHAYLACLEAESGNRAAAMEHLRAAVKERAVSADFLLSQPELKALQQDPEFREVIGIK